MNKVESSTIAFRVYEDAVDFCGIADITLPNISFMSETITGSGISGEYDSALLGFVSAMSMDMKFRSTTESAFRLAEPRRHQLDLRVSHQSEDVTSGEITTPTTKYVVVVMPKELNLGNIKAASVQEVSGKYSVQYLAMYQDGVKKLEIDPLNFICYINGIDYLANVRNAIGK